MLISAWDRGDEMKPELPKMPEEFLSYQRKLQGKSAKIANFADNSGNGMNQDITTEDIKAARAKYDSYDDKWIKAYFDWESGGYNVYHKKHLFSSAGRGGEAEKTVGRLLAKNEGKQIEFLPEGGEKKPDWLFDKQTWDIKRITDANEETIRTYIKDSRKADNGIFYWDGKDDKLDMLISATGRTAGYLKKKNELHTMPNIYYMDNGRLKLLGSKK